MSKPFELDNIPTKVTWIKSLSKEEAVAQCAAWGLTPKGDLEAIRVQLKKVVCQKKGGSESEALGEGDLTEEQEGQQPHPPSAAQSATPAGDRQFNFPALTEPADLPGLVKSLHAMTLQAIEATAHAVATRVTTPIRGQSSSCLADAPLPSIVRDMVREVPVTSGTDLAELVKFLGKISKIVELKLVPDQAVVLNAIPRTEGRLRDFWVGMVNAASEWPETLQTIRAAFFTPRSLRELQSLLMYRHQRASEPYADYVAEIAAIFQILAGGSSDAEIFSAIFSGLNPQTRAAFAGLQPPTSVKQLREMVPIIESLSGPVPLPPLMATQATPPNNYNYRGPQGNSNFASWPRRPRFYTDQPSSDFRRAPFQSFRPSNNQPFSNTQHFSSRPPGHWNSTQGRDRNDFRPPEGGTQQNRAAINYRRSSEEPQGNLNSHAGNRYQGRPSPKQAGPFTR